MTEKKGCFSGFAAFVKFVKFNLLIIISELLHEMFWLLFNFIGIKPLFFFKVSLENPGKILGFFKKT